MKLQAGIAIFIILVLIIAVVILLNLRGEETVITQYQKGKVLLIKPIEINNTFNKNEEKTFKFNVSNLIDFDVKNIKIYSKLSPDWKVNDKSEETLEIFSINNLPPKSFTNFDVKLKAPDVQFEYTFSLLASYSTSTKISALIEFSKNGKVKSSKVHEGYISLKEIKANFSAFGKVPINFTVDYPKTVQIEKVEGIYRLENCNLVKENIINCIINVGEYKDSIEVAVELKIYYNVTKEEAFSTKLKIV
jgi:hypothetical protein